MKSNKYLAQIVIFNIFRFSLYLLVTIVAVFVVFSNATGVKQAFVHTKAYERFVPLTLDAAIKANQNSNSAPIKDPAVQQIIKDSFPASKLKLETENVIDSVYAWLYGVVPKPEFKADFSHNIEQMANGLSAYAINRLKSQPICNENPNSVDPFTATCRPAKFDYFVEQQTLKNEIIKNNGIISNSIITVDSLPKNDDGKTILDKYSYAPSLFRLFLYTPLIIFSITFASALALVALDRKKRVAVRNVGSNIVSANIFLILSPIVYFYVLPFIFPAMNKNSTSGGGAAVLGDVINRLTIDFSNKLIIIGVISLLIGVAIILLEKSTRPKSKYVKIDKKSGLTSSEIRKNKKGKPVLSESSVPLQTSEARSAKHKYLKNKKYRKIPKKEF